MPKPGRHEPSGPWTAVKTPAGLFIWASRAAPTAKPASKGVEGRGSMCACHWCALLCCWRLLSAGLAVRWQDQLGLMQRPDGVG